MDTKNIEAALSLLRPMFDCLKYIFLVSTVDDPNGFCEKIFEPVPQISDLKVTARWFNDGKKVGLGEGAIPKMMDGSGLFKGMSDFYGHLCSYVHNSPSQISHIFSEDPGQFTIGGDIAFDNETLVKEAWDDFNLIQSICAKMVHYI